MKDVIYDLGYDLVYGRSDQESEQMMSAVKAYLGHVSDCTITRLYCREEEYVRTF